LDHLFYRTVSAAGELRKGLQPIHFRVSNAGCRSTALAGLGCRTGSTMPLDTSNSRMNVRHRDESSTVVDASVLQEGNPRAAALSPLTDAHRQLIASGSSLGRHHKAARRRRARYPVSVHANKGAHGWHRHSALSRTRVVAGRIKRCELGFWGPVRHVVLLLHESHVAFDLR
jgi:hypothetical protein